MTEQRENPYTTGGVAYWYRPGMASVSLGTISRITVDKVTEKSVMVDGVRYPLSQMKPDGSISGPRLTGAVYSYHPNLLPEGHPTIEKVAAEQEYRSSKNTIQGLLDAASRRGAVEDLAKLDELMVALRVWRTVVAEKQGVAE